MAAITTLVDFDFPDNQSPVGPLVEDAAGDLFGTAAVESPQAKETVFEIVKTRDGYASAPTILATFDDYSFFSSGLALDAAGDVFAEANAFGAGDLVEIAKASGGYAAPALIAQGAGLPAGSPVVDAAGDLFYATNAAGSQTGVNVYEVAASGSGYTSAPALVAAIPSMSFQGSNAVTPGQPSLAFDTAGDLFVGYNVSSYYNHSDGFVDEFAKTATGYASAPTVLGYAPADEGSLDSISVDAAGNVFAAAGGNLGVLTEFAKTADGYASPVNIAENLPSGDLENVAADADGDLFLATQYGQYGSGYGEVLELTPDASDSYYSQTVVASFTDDDYGVRPNAVILGPGGDLYGTTQFNGPGAGGTLFRIDLQPTPQPAITGASVASGHLSIAGTLDVADAAVPVAIYDGDDFLGDAYANASGAWSVTFGGHAPVGENDLEAVATNALGGEGSSKVTLFDNTSNVWGATSGASGPVFLDNAQVSITAGGAIVYLEGVGDAASLYNTAGVWDAVTGDDGAVTLNGAQASLVGGADQIYFDGSSSNAVSLYATKGIWDTIHGDHGSVTLNVAQASVLGGGDTVYLDGSAYDAVSLYQTSAWDAVYGDGGSITLNGAQASLVGESNFVTLAPGGGSAVSVYGTGTDDDFVEGSGGYVTLNSAQADIGGGSNVIYFAGADDVARLGATGDDWDTVYAAAGGAVGLDGGKASVVGSSVRVAFAGTGNAVSLYGAGGQDRVTGNGGDVILNGAQAAVDGGGDSIYFSSTVGASVAIANTNGVADNVYGSHELIGLVGSQALINGDSDNVAFHGASTASLNGDDFTGVFDPQIGLETIAGFNATDVLQFSSLDYASYPALSPHVAQSGADTVITYDADDAVTLKNVQATTLTSANFTFR